MKFRFLRRKKFWKRLLFWLVAFPVLLFTVLITVVYFKQDAIVQDLIRSSNEDFTGMIRIKDSHVAPFANFPYISIDLEELEIYEFKEAKKEERLVHVHDAYIGFNLFDILSGDMDVKSIKLKGGDLKIVQHKDGSFNIANAFKSKKPAAEVEEDLHLNLKKITLDDIDISKLNEANNILIDAYITSAHSSFETSKKGMDIGLDAQFQLSIISDGDTTFIKHKHFELETDIALNEKTQVLTIAPTEILLEKASFSFDGTVDLNDDCNLNLNASGNKPNFDLFLAMAPEELVPALEKFDNKGTIFFEAHVKGKSLNGNQPAIDARFGCKNGFFNNTESHKTLNGINFKGTFTNGEKRDISTMRFELENFSAKPEAGVFSGKLRVENFEAPDIDMRLKSDFNLDFLARFFSIPELKGLSGRIALTMNFHDIIDIDNPERSIERLNESYFSELLVENLKFSNKSFHLPVHDLDMRATLRGHRADIEQCDLKVGKSDLRITGDISDLPAVIHHTALPVQTDLEIHSRLLDIHELTSGDPEKKPVDEQIENLSLKLKFLSSARALTESPHLPKGEFFIEDLYAKMKHYPHTLHDFHADVFVEDEDFRIIDFRGFIDRSDFHFSGRLNNYGLWFEEKLQGDTEIEFDLTSNMLQFHDLFSYGGENFVPEDYRHEELTGLKLHGRTALHFNEGLQSTDLYLTQFNGKMKVHPLRLDHFSGRIHLEREQLKVENLHGRIGHSEFTANADYFLGEGKGRHANVIRLSAPRLDFDELMNYHERPAAKTGTPSPAADHDKVFSIYDFQFPELSLHLDIGHLNYHKYLLNHFKADLRTETNHMLHVDKLAFDAAGGHFAISGYLSGKDKEHIYFKPDIHVKNVDLDKFMVKFDNFGQDHVVSENLHGKFTGHITGKIHLHADLVPKIDDSDLSVKMTILNGRLENYGPVLALSDYFEDRNLSKVHFDTLSNTFTLKHGTLNIPAMTINSSLGFMEISGSQGISGKMDMHYVVGVPWKMITQAASSKLFRRKQSEAEESEEIQYRKKNSKFVYVKISGDLENYKVSLGKKGG